MRIGDAAAAAGTTPRALRLYEANGLLPPPRRTVTGQRVYGPREVTRLRVIRQLLDLGLTVADLRDRSDRLHLLEGGRSPGYGEPGARTEPAVVAARRSATLNAEVTRLRDRLVTRSR